MSERFEIEKQSIVESINNAEKIIDKILDNTVLELATSEQLKKLEAIKIKNHKYRNKLSSNEFEVAIVGLEKAGKSTFANALIDNDVLPSAPERCTFTTTRLVSGNDKAVIKFYDEVEFENIFQTMLQEIRYPNSENISYKNLSKEHFEQYFDKLEQSDPSLYKSHVGKTNEEILDIIRCRETLSLKGDVLEFHGEELNSDEFKEYIKGKQGDTSKPRSVKSIEIQSSRLQKMKNIIMYDVPGFDSPTQLHMRQTEERLKSADAIILVTNVGTNPSIQGTSLNVIRNNTDDDGIALKDKLFIFGNQIDRVNTEEQIEGNSNILRSDVAKHKIGIDDRVFVGSALSYLNKNHRSKYEIDDGIEKIRNSLIDYYQKERFEILKRKVDRANNELKEIFNNIKEINTINGEINIDESILKHQITYQESKDIEKRLRIKLKDYFHSLKEEIYKEKWLSRKMQEQLRSGNHFLEIDEEDFHRAQRISNESLRRDIPCEQVNRNLRKELHLKYLENYLDIIQCITDEKCKEVEQNLLWVFAHAVCGELKPNDEILHRCKNLIDNITNEVAHQRDRFGYLIERFSRDIFDIMLSFPIASQDRLNRYHQASHDMRHLDHYYSKGSGKLISLILVQKNNDILDLARPLLPVVKRLMDLASNVKIGENQYKQIKDFYEILSGNKVSSLIIESFDVDKFLLNHTIKSSQNCEEVVKEINADINNLRDILIKSVIPAIDLEVVFLNSIDKQIKLLLSSMDNHNQYAKIFNNFTSFIVTLVKKEELDNISQEMEMQKIKKEVIEQINDFL